MSKPVELSSGCAGTFPVDVHGHTYVLKQDPTSMNHGLVLWDSASALLDWIQSQPKVLDGIRGKKVLELGSGCGLVGLVLADQLGADVTLTDLPSVVDNLMANVAANPVGRDSNGGRTRVKPFCWGDPIDELLADGPFDYVVGTDVAYSELLIPTLLRSAAMIASASEELGRSSMTSATRAASKSEKHACTVLLANEMRCEKAHTVFEAESAAHFNATKIPAKQLRAAGVDEDLLLYKLRVKCSIASRKGDATAPDQASAPAVGSLAATDE